LIIAAPASEVKAFINQILARKTESLPPREAAVFLFELDNDAYALQGAASIRAEGGVHPKHRITKYHDFFVQRIHKGEKILDIGCRTGEVAAEVVARTGAQLTGIDIDSEALVEGRKKFPHLQLLDGDVYTWKPPHTFDTVLMSNVLEHLQNRPSLLKDLQKRTSASRFLIRVPLYERDWRAGYKRDLGIEWRLDHTHETEFSVESFASEMGEAGLTIYHLECRWGEIWAELHVTP
jgi:SAM-dependent methyltransferase